MDPRPAPDKNEENSGVDDFHLKQNLAGQDYMNKHVTTGLANVSGPTYYSRALEAKVLSLVSRFSAAKKRGEHCIYANPNRPTQVVRPVVLKSKRRRREGSPLRLPLDFQFIRRRNIRYIIVYLRVSSDEQRDGLSLEDRLTRFLFSLAEIGIEVFAITWDSTKGDVPFAERPGWPIAKGLLLQGLADAIGVPLIQRWSRHTRSGMDEAWSLTDLEKPLAFAITESDRDLLVADMRDPRIMDVVYRELRTAEDGLQDQRQKNHNAKVGMAARREWYGPWRLPFHRRERPLPGRKKNRIRRADDTMRKAEHLIRKLVRVGTETEVQRLAAHLRLDIPTLRWYLGSGLLAGFVRVGQAPPIHHDVVQVVPLWLQERVDELLLRLYPPKPEKSTVYEQLVRNYGAGYVHHATGLCPPCRHCGGPSKLRKRGDVERKISDVYLCENCDKTFDVPLHPQWARFPPPRSCDGCGMPLLDVVGQQNLPGKEVVLERACSNPQCGAYDWLGLQLDHELGREALNRITKSHPLVPKPRRRFTPKLVRKSPAPKPGRASLKPPREPDFSRPIKPKAEKSWMRPGRRKTPVLYPELRQASMEFWKNHAATYHWNFSQFARSEGLRNSEISRILNGFMVPLGRIRDILLKFPEFAVLRHAEELHARNRYWKPRRGQRSRVAREGCKFPRVRDVFVDWFEQNRAAHGGTRSSVARFLHVDLEDLTSYMLGMRRPALNTRRRLAALTGYNLFEDV